MLRVVAHITQRLQDVSPPTASPCAVHAVRVTFRPACSGMHRLNKLSHVKRAGAIKHRSNPMPDRVQCTLSSRQNGEPNTCINNATKWTVSLVAGGTLLWRHDIYVTWCLLGSILAVFLCKVTASTPAKLCPALVLCFFIWLSRHLKAT